VRQIYAKASFFENIFSKNVPKTSLFEQNMQNFWGILTQKPYFCKFIGRFYDFVNKL
jgi:hypothetical protein